jgi:hypothetical protein
MKRERRVTSCVATQAQRYIQRRVSRATSLRKHSVTFNVAFREQRRYASTALHSTSRFETSVAFRDQRCVKSADRRSRGRGKIELLVAINFATNLDDDVVFFNAVRHL